MSDKGKDMGVFNIVNKRTGKKYTAGSTNMDQLMNKYDYEMEHGTHHNEGLRKDGEEGDTFRFEVVSRDCENEDEVRALRDAEIHRNRKNTYNKDVNIYFDGGNPNAEFPHGKRTGKLNNVEHFPTSHNNIKPKEVKSKRTMQNTKLLNDYAKKYKSNVSNELIKELNEEINSGNITSKTQISRRIRENEQKNKSNKQTNTKKIPKSHIDNPRYYGKNKIPEKPKRNLGSKRRVRRNSDIIRRRKIVETQIKRRIEQVLVKEKGEGIEVTENINQILNNSQEIDEKISLISNSVIKKHLEWKNERLKKEIEEIDIEISQLKSRIEDLEDKLDELENDKKQLKEEYLTMDEELYKIEYKKIFELEKSSLGQKSWLNRRLKQLERKRKRIIEEP